MKLMGEAVFLNAEVKQGKKDPNNTYCMALLMSGTNTLEVLLDTTLYNGVLSQIPQFTKCECEFEYNTLYKSLRLVGIVPVE